MDTWVPIITGLFTLFGAIGGGWITAYGNGKVQKDKLSIEISRENNTTHIIKKNAHPLDWVFFEFGVYIQSKL